MSTILQAPNDRKNKPWRLLVCFTCYTIERLPPYEGREGPDGSYLEPDPILEHLLEPHRHGGPRWPETGTDEHRGMIMRVDEGTWNSMKARQRISKELFKEEAERVAFKDTLHDDAGKCYQRHGRPGQGLVLNCHDYRSDSKRLSSPATNERKTIMDELGIDVGPALARKAPVFLCSFCAYESQVMTIKRRKRGMYK